VVHADGHERHEQREPEASPEAGRSPETSCATITVYGLSTATP
jgi:hypothetical protein